VVYGGIRGGRRVGRRMEEIERLSSGERSRGRGRGNRGQRRRRERCLAKVA